MIELLTRNYKFPFPFRSYQEDDITLACTYDRVGLYEDMGLGKTAIATAAVLCKGLLGQVDHAIIVCPPIILDQWKFWLDGISELNPGLTSVIYRGTPAKRKTIDVKSGDFIIMSMQIFKNDIRLITEKFRRNNLVLVIDEAAAIRNPKTKNFKTVRDFSVGQHLILLTGTPLNSPLHAYGYIKLITPTVYRSFNQFKNLHIEKLDFWKNPVAFKNMDLLQENLMLQSVVRHTSDCMELPEISFVPVRYRLTSEHYTLYRKLMEEKLLVLEDKVIDATEAMRLFHQSQQLIMSPQAYSDTEIVPNGYQIINNTLDELEGGKLIIFNNYRLTNEKVMEYLESKNLNPVLCYGGLTPKKRQEVIEAFKYDDTCKVFVASPRSAGIGIDGLQAVCNYALFMELPITSNDFSQAIKRVHRSGQKRNCVIKIAIADHTIQVLLQKRVVDKDDLIQQIIPTPQSLRKAFYGEV